MRALLGLSLGLLLLSSCGRVFCVGPFGPVDECYAEPQGSTSTGTTTTGFHIAVSPAKYQGVNSPAGTTLSLTATNGTDGATFTWSKTPISASTTPPVLSAATGVAITFSSTAGETGSYTVTVTDSSNGTTASTAIFFDPTTL